MLVLSKSHFSADKWLNSHPATKGKDIIFIKFKIINILINSYKSFAIHNIIGNLLDADILTASNRPNNYFFFIRNINLNLINS